MPGEREEPETPPHGKLLGGGGLKLRAAAAGVAILAGGALIAPPAAPTAVPVSEERAVPLLQEEVQRREPARLFRGVQEIVRRVGAYSIEIPQSVAQGRRTIPDTPTLATPARAVSGYGVVVDAAGGVITHAAALGGRMTLPVHSADGSPVDARVAAHEPGTGLVLLRIAGTRPAPAPVTGARPEPGALAAAAVRRNGGEVASPVFVTAVGDAVYSIASPGTPLGAGTPLYNVDGEAFAIAAGPQSGHLAYPLAAAVERLTAREASGRAFDGSLGVSFQSTTGLARWFPTPGALVSAVLPAGPAAAAGIAPGDVLIAIDAATVDSPAAAQRAIASMAPTSVHAISVRRGTRTLTLSATAGSAFQLADRWGAHPPADGRPSAALVLAPEALAASGIPGEALLLEVDGRDVDSGEAASRELRRAGRPVLVYLQHDGERFYAALGEPR